MKKYYITKSHTVKIKVISTMSFIKKKRQNEFAINRGRKKVTGRREREKENKQRDKKKHYFSSLFYFLQGHVELEIIFSD